MTIKQASVYLLVLVVVLTFVYVKGYQTGKHTTIVTPAVLKPTDKEQVIVDPFKHKITTVTHTGVTTTTLPNRPTTITEHNDGSITVNTPQFGYEQRPFIGFGFSHVWKIVAGADMLYFKSLDLGPAVMFAPNNPFDTMRFAGVLSYNFKSNTRIGVSVDHLGGFGLFFTVRL